MNLTLAAWLRVIGEGLVFLFGMAGFFVFVWLVSP